MKQTVHSASKECAIFWVIKMSFLAKICKFDIYIFGAVLKHRIAIFTNFYIYILCESTSAKCSSQFFHNFVFPKKRQSMLAVKFNIPP